MLVLRHHAVGCRLKAGAVGGRVHGQEAAGATTPLAQIHRRMSRLYFRKSPCRTFPHQGTVAWPAPRRIGRKNRKKEKAEGIRTASRPFPAVFILSETEPTLSARKLAEHHIPVEELARRPEIVFVNRPILTRTILTGSVQPSFELLPTRTRGSISHCN